MNEKRTLLTLQAVDITKSRYIENIYSESGEGRANCLKLEGYGKDEDKQFRTLKLYLDDVDRVWKHMKGGPEYYLLSPMSFDGSRHGNNYIETTAIALDFDGSEVLEHNKEVLDGLGISYVIRYSSRHGIKPGERHHIFIPIDRPFSTNEEVEMVKAWCIEHFGEGVDMSSFSAAKPFFPGHRELDPIVVDTGKVLKIGSLKPKVAVAKPAVKKQRYNVAAARTRITLKLDTMLETEKYGTISVRDAISLGDPNINCGCPVCFRDPRRGSPNQFNAHFLIPDNNAEGIWAVHCLSCKSRPPAQEFYHLDTNEVSREVQEDESTFFFYDKTNGKLVIAQRNDDGAIVLGPTTAAYAKNEHKRWGIPMPEVIDAYEPKLVFGSDERFLIQRGVFNTYDAPEILRTPADSSKVIPPAIRSFIRWLLGVDNLKGVIADPHAEATYEYFLDWLAFIVQKRTKAYTTWIFQGTQGTGKDAFLKYVLAKIFGKNFTTDVSQDRLKSNFNSYALSKVFIAVNEAEMEKAHSNLQASLKMWITQEQMACEAKGVDTVTSTNAANFIFFTNKPNSVELETGDRRFNVGYRQEVAIMHAPFVGGVNIQEWYNEQLTTEVLRDFVAFLKAREYNPKVSYVTIENSPKNDLKEEALSKTAILWKTLQDRDETKLRDLLDDGDVTPFGDVSYGAAIYRELMKYYDDNVFTASAIGQAMKFLLQINSTNAFKMSKNNLREAQSFGFIPTQKHLDGMTRKVYIRQDL